MPARTMKSGDGRHRGPQRPHGPLATAPLTYRSLSCSAHCCLHILQKWFGAGATRCGSCRPCWGAPNGRRLRPACGRSAAGGAPGGCCFLWRPAGGGAGRLGTGRGRQQQQRGAARLQQWASAGDERRPPYRQLAVSGGAAAAAAAQGPLVARALPPAPPPPPRSAPHPAGGCGRRLLHDLLPLLSRSADGVGAGPRGQPPRAVKLQLRLLAAPFAHPADKRCDQRSSLHIQGGLRPRCAPAGLTRLLPSIDNARCAPWSGWCTQPPPNVMAHLV